MDHFRECFDRQVSATDELLRNFLNGPAPKEEEMEPDKYCDKHKCYYAPNEGCEKCTTERRALAREAYMAALGGTCACEDAPVSVPDVVALSVQTALETVRRWDAFMAAVDAEGGE